MRDAVNGRVEGYESGSMMSWGKTKTYLDLLLHDIMNRDNARERSNFEYMSFGWGVFPGWYFWPKRRKGVYALKELGHERRGLRNRYDAHFALYYYPALTEEVMADYSLLEKIIRRSELFDEGEIHVSGCCHHEPVSCGVRRTKGIPTHYGREVMSADLFVIALVELLWMKDLLSRCVVRAAERWQTIAGGSVDRNVPCWELAWFFINTLTTDVNRPYTIATETDDSSRDGVVKSATIAFIPLEAGQK
jgi:hypothetical protein